MATWNILRLIILSALIAGSVPFGASITFSAPTQTQISRNEADRLFQQGIEQYQKQQLEAAIDSWQRSLTLYRTLQDQLAEATILKNLSAVYLRLQNYDAAITHLEQWLMITRALKDQSGEISVLTALAETSTKQGRYVKAIEYYQQNLELVNKQGDRATVARTLGNLAIAHKVLGRYVTAIDLNQQAIKILQELNDRRTEGRVYGNLGNAYEALGDYDQAIAAYQKSIQIAQAIKDEAGAGTSLGNLGALYANLGDYDRAISLQKQSLKISQTLGHQAGEASTLINLGAVFHSLQQPKQAIQHYQQSLQIAQTINDPRRQAEAFGSLGLAYEDLQDYPKAIEHHQKSLTIAKTINDPKLQVMALNNLGHALFNSDRLTEAEQVLRSAIQLSDALRSGLTDAYQVSVFDTQLHTYSLLQQVLVAAKKPEAALEASEQGRARAFADLLARRFSKQPESSNNNAETQTPTIAQIQQIAREQNATLVEYAILPSDEFKFRGKQRAPAAGLLIWVVQPTGNIIFRQVDLKSLNQPGSPNSTTISPGSNSKQRNYSLTNLIQNTRTAIRGTESPNPSDTDDSKQPIEFSVSDPSQVQNQLKQLHQFLIAPIANVLPTNPDDRVIFIPQETLFLVPFAALQDAENKYLIEKHTILIAPSIQVLSFTQSLQAQRQTTEQSSPLIVGNPTMPKIALAADQPLEQLSPLPGAEEEATAIAKLFKTQALIGAEGTKAIVLQKIRQAPLVHLATHGLLEYSSPDSQSSLQGLGIPGAIALAPSQKDDGLLTANEILNLRLGAELVVLSACDTGQGRITGDGVIGLSRALIAAGAPSVVVSLWAVPDSPTAQLMIAFYQNLQQQPDKAKALRKAMLTTMKDYPDPIDWAAFTLIGEAE
jgi:CHAT domain-containing protein/tetratricopeptide (TPR) repeat protein